jgi:hypothetical protein
MVAIELGTWRCIKHAQGYFLWDTGVIDTTPANPRG